RDTLRHLVAVAPTPGSAAEAVVAVVAGAAAVAVIVAEDPHRMDRVAATVEEAVAGTVEAMAGDDI
ncbi:MAG TPA: hypothetical protein VKT33_09490, partial [Candidatus Angelobacter sp.]|nr:hypothetical protein [Candidatus Angelobacter sp.]